jgi:TRAP-type uncharacterized transport system substrate-binding protein
LRSGDRRPIGFSGRAALLALAASAAGAHATVRTPDPIPISIGGGVPESAAFRWSSALADTLSRPPGLPECDKAMACGVPGVIASAQTYDDPGALLNALVAGKVTTAILPALRPYRARCAAPSPAAAQPIRALKALYRQKLQIVLRPGAGVASPKDFGRKTIVVGEPGSDSEAVALALIDAYGLARAKIKLVRIAPPGALDALRSGNAVAGFFLGYAYNVGIADLIKKGFTLMSLPDSPERARLLQTLSVFEADAITPDAYPGVPPTSTLSQPVDWLAGPGLDPLVSEKLVAAISEPHNLTRLYDLIDPVPAIPEGQAFLRLPVAAAEGAVAAANKAHLPIGVLDCSAAPR